MKQNNSLNSSYPELIENFKILMHTLLGNTLVEKIF